MSPPIKFKLQTIENCISSPLAAAVEVYVEPSMAGQSSGRIPDVGKGVATVVVDFVVELAVWDVELLPVVEAIVLEVEEVEILDVEEVELLCVEAERPEAEELDAEVAVKLTDEEVDEGCDGLTMRSAFRKSSYLRSKFGATAIQRKTQ